MRPTPVAARWPQRRGRPSHTGRRLATLALLIGGAAVAMAFAQPARVAALVLPSRTLPAISATAESEGISRAVDLAVALPGDSVNIPVDLGPDSLGMEYRWVRLGDTLPPAPAIPFDRATLYAPARPGLYRLELVRGDDGVLLATPTLGVLVPFDQKRGGRINGYRIGTYRGERRSAEARPPGFLPVDSADADLPVSTHLRLADFLTHDGQQHVWPKYVAIDPRLLDKLELVLAKLEGWGEHSVGMQLEIDVHSGFRTPLYNRTVPRAADDSQHQFGDAADVTLDANGDGRIDRRDVAAIVRAVEAVEAAHPSLVGGLGVYTSRRYAVPYVHIDARGVATRWRG